MRRADHLSAEQDAWSACLRGEQPLTLPPHTCRRVIIDLERYYCAYPELIDQTRTLAAGRNTIVK